MIELHADKPFFIDDPGAAHLAVGFEDQHDSMRFVGFVRPYRVEPDDGRYLDASVSVEFGLDEPLRGIYPDAIDEVRLERNRLTLALKGECDATIAIHFRASDAEYDRLVITLSVMFDGTGRLVLDTDDRA
jgi:hypothetical protein